MTYCRSATTAVALEGLEMGISKKCLYEVLAIVGNLLEKPPGERD